MKENTLCFEINLFLDIVPSKFQRTCANVSIASRFSAEMDYPCLALLLSVWPLNLTQTLVLAGFFSVGIR